MKNFLLNKKDASFSFILSVTGLLLFAQMLITMLGGSFALAGIYWNAAHELNNQYSFFITWCIASGFSVFPFMIWIWGFARFNRHIENKRKDSWTIVPKGDTDGLQSRDNE